MYVSIGKVRSGSKGRSYYLKLSHESGALNEAGNYYLKSSPLEGVGRWSGRLAAEFGLSGTVTPEDFRSLHNGYSPSGEPLSRNVGSKSRRAGFDVTAGLVKDASIVASRSDHWRRRIFAEVAAPAVEVAMQYLEREACRSRRGRQGSELVAGRGFAVCSFEHMAARSVDGQAVDPQAHVHNVVFNTTRGPDGELRTLDGEALYFHAQTAAALASVEESYRLEQMGFTLARDGRSFRIVGIPDQLREENSKRSSQIRGHAGKDASAKERDRANWETREPKEAVDVPALLMDWQERNERHGLTEERLRELTRTKPRERDVARELEEATTRAIKQLTRGESTFTEQKFLEYAAIESQCRGVSGNDVRLHVWKELELARRGHHAELIYRGVEDGHEHFCTRELFELEAAVLRAAHSTRHEKSRIREQDVERAIAAKGTLSLDQEKAVRGLSLKAGRIRCLVGGAGTGKTFALDAVRIAHDAAGYRCLGTAVANRAARGLARDANMEALNTKKLLYELDRGRLRLDGVCLFLDEAATVDTREMAKIIAAVNKAKDARLITVGDQRQHQAVGPSGVFAELCTRLGPPEELTEIIRQKERVEREMVAAFRDREIGEALRVLLQRNRLHVGDEVEDSQERLVKDWADDKTPLAEKRIIASTNQQCDHLNAKCNQLLEERGALTGEAVSIKGDFVARVGSRVIVRKTIARLDVSNGDCGTVIGTSAARDELRVRLDQGGRVVTIPLSSYRDGVHAGYAATSFLSQGASYDSVFLFVHGHMTDAQTGYVMASRHRQTCRMYTTRDDAGEGLTKLERDFARDRMKRMAHAVGGASRDEDSLERRLTHTR
ncbi:MAG: MobF family relaxase [Isosphaeraceae bacterium]